VGPRTGRFDNGQVVEFTYGNKALQALGTFILWFGWYGFNCGSTLALSGGTANVAAKVAFNTTLAPALSCLVTVLLSRLVLRHYDISLCLNGVLAGVCVLVYVGSLLLSLRWRSHLHTHGLYPYSGNSRATACGSMVAPQ
jgi:Amt family ammonium transporter